jgi:hypothetical protein
MCFGELSESTWIHFRQGRWTLAKYTFFSVTEALLLPSPVARQDTFTCLHNYDNSFDLVLSMEKNFGSQFGDESFPQPMPMFVHSAPLSVRGAFQHLSLILPADVRVDDSCLWLSKLNEACEMSKQRDLAYSA